jgi:dTDP-4-amino-4,6-dideoxygalactose transaminase
MSTLRNKFEEAFAEKMGVGSALAVSSARNGLHLILKLITKPGDEVILPAFICGSVVSSVRAAGAKPVFVDIKDDLTMDEGDVEKKMTSKTKVILAVHIYGRPTKVDLIQKVCNQNELILIEDCAQALGARYQNKMVGSIGDFAIYSLTKSGRNSGGGVIVTEGKGVKNQLMLLGEQLGKRKGSLSKLMELPYSGFKYVASIYESEGSLTAKRLLDLVAGASKLLGKKSDDGLNTNFGCSSFQLKRAWRQLQQTEKDNYQREEVFTYLLERLRSHYKVPGLPEASNPLHLYFPLIVGSKQLRKRLLKGGLSSPWKCFDETCLISKFTSENLLFFPLGKECGRGLKWLTNMLIDLRGKVK